VFHPVLRASETEHAAGRPEFASCQDELGQKDHTNNEKAGSKKGREHKLRADEQ